MSNVKVGDKVRFKADGSNDSYRKGKWPESTAETVFTVDRINEYGNAVLKDPDGRGTPFGDGTNPSRLQVVPTVTAVKVGDIVRSTVDYCGIKAGRLYAVDSAPSEGGIYVVADSPGRYLTRSEFETDPKPQVGDTIEALVDDCDTTEGSHYVVTSIDPDGEVHFRDDIGDDWWLEVGQYKLVPTKIVKPAAQTEKPKAGDKVKAMVEGSCCFTAGNIYEVIRFDGDDDSVLAVADDGDENWLFDGEFELVNEEAAPAPAAVDESAFKVGDKVEVVDPSLFRVGTKVGDVGYVTYAQGSRLGIDLHHQAYGVIGQICGVERVKLATPEAAPVPAFKVGDRIRVKGEDGVSGVVVNFAPSGSLVIKRDDGNGWSYDQYDVDGAGWFVSPSDAELVSEPAAVPAFKVGDRVKFVDHPYILDGDQHTGVILELRLDGRRGDFSVTIDNYVGSPLGFYARELAAVEELKPSATFKVGDTVKIVRKVTNEEGWDNCWITSMDEYVGNGVSYEVAAVDKYGATLKGAWYGFPHGSLELVAAATTIPVAANDNTVTVTLRKDASVSEQLEAIAAALRAA